MKKQLIKLALVGTALMLLSLPAWAVPTLYLSDGTAAGTVIIQDGGIGDANGAVGVITYVGSLNNGPWAINVTTGETKPAIGTAAIPQMDLSSLNTSSIGPGTLHIIFSDDNFMGLPPNYGFLSTIGGTTIGSVTYNTYFDTGNNLLQSGEVNLLNSLAFNSPGGTFAFAGSATSGAVNIAPTTPYSLTIDLLITHAGRGSTSLDASNEAVPEPSALLLLGSGLTALGIWKIRKRS